MNMWNSKVRAKDLYQKMKVKDPSCYIIKKSLLHSLGQICILSIFLYFNFYTASPIPEVTSIILRIPRPLKVTLLSSLLFAAKIICIFIHGKTCPSVNQFIYVKELLTLTYPLSSCISRLHFHLRYGP